jgi:hypothetical protein
MEPLQRFCLHLKCRVEGLEQGEVLRARVHDLQRPIVQDAQASLSPKHGVSP